MELTRKQVIEELQKMLDYCSIRQDSTPERKQALVYAISSLKTDEAYQIMYEGGEIFTKDEVIAMITGIINEIEEKVIRKQGIDSDFEYDYEFIQSEEVVEIIQQKINALKGDE